MNMHEFSVENRERCESLRGFNHKLESWSLGDWLTAVLGELGEAANVAKKLNRVRDGISGNKETPGELLAALGEELADVYIYLDLLAQAMGETIANASLELLRHPFDEYKDGGSASFTHAAFCLGSLAQSISELLRDDFADDLSDLADAVIDIAAYYGIPFKAAIRAKFDKISAEIGYTRGE